MPAPRRFELDDILNRPGTYFNPDTEVLIVVDDATAVDSEIFEEDGNGGEWVLIGDDVPIDERRRDELIERFEVRHHPGATGAIAASEDDDFEPDEELEPDEDPDEL
jgi:GT2 family glycosyltransferase